MGLQQLTPGWATQNIRSLSDAAMPLALSGLQQSAQPFKGNLVAGFNSNQLLGNSLLSQYLSSPSPTQSGLYGQAYNELSQTLSGKDPYQSEYIKAFQTYTNQLLGQSKERLNARMAKKNESVSSDYDSANAQLEVGAMGQMLNALAPMVMQERQNQLSATSLAQALLGFGESADVGRITNAYNLGSVQQNQEQAVLDAAYNEWIRQQNAKGNAMNVALQTSMFTPEYMYKSKGGSSILGGLSGIGSLLGGLGGISSSTGAAGSTTGASGLMALLSMFL